MVNLKDFIDSLNSNWQIALTALIGSGTLLYLDKIECDYIKSAPQYLIIAAFAIFIFSSAILVTKIISSILDFLKRLIEAPKRNKLKQKMLDEIQFLSNDEIFILSYLASTNKKSFTAEMNHKRLIPLMGRGMIIRLRGKFNVLNWPFRVDDDVWEYIKLRPQQFQIENVNRLDDPLDWRTGHL
ncbi:MAG: super-infection exclusion protein B [Pannonibacter sp.]